MAVTREIRKYIESENYEALEDVWLSRLGEDAGDLEFFVGTARAVAGNGAQEQAKTLLELADGELKAGSDWETRLELLRQAGHLLFNADDLYAETLSTLSELYPDSRSFDGLRQEVGLGRAIHDTSKNWQKIAKLRDLLQFEIGAVVSMEGKGAGRVSEVNFELRSFKIGFEQFKGLRVGFSAAPKLLRPLAEGDFLRRKLEDPEALERLKSERPAELLRLVFGSQDGAMVAAKIRGALVGLVSEQEWTSWWASARKHPQILTEGSAGRQSYRWAGSSEDAQHATRAAFSSADLAGQLEIFRRSASRSDPLRDELAAELRARAEIAADSDPPAALVIWWALKRAGANDDRASWAPDALLTASSNPARLVRSLADRSLREYVLTRLAACREEWPDVYRQLLDQEQDPRTLTLLAEGLREAHPERLESFLNDIFSQPRKRPAAFVWIAERAAGDESVEGRNPLRFLQQILEASSLREFAPFKARLKATVEAGEGLVRLFSLLTEDQAPQAQEAIKRALLEEHHRSGLITALELKFPSLRQEQGESLYATRHSIELRRDELRKLLDQEIPENRAAIQVAREMGDLRENFEYKSARQRHEYLSARVARLEGELAMVQPIELDKIDPRVVRIGTRTALEGGGSQRTITILGPWESDPEAGVISYDSDLGRQLLGKETGDSVQIDGESLTIDEIEVID